MSYGKTPMNFVQRTKKQMRKADRRTKNKGVQKHTSLKRDGVEMRNRPQRMTRYPKEKIDSLSKFNKRDPRIRIPLDRKPSDIRLLIRIDRLPNDRNPKSFSHYPRGNDELNTSYPTPNQGVGIIDVAKEIQEKLSNRRSRVDDLPLTMTTNLYSQGLP